MGHLRYSRLKCIKWLSSSASRAPIGHINFPINLLIKTTEAIKFTILIFASLAHLVSSLPAVVETTSNIPSRLQDPTNFLTLFAPAISFTVVEPEVQSDGGYEITNVECDVWEGSGSIGDAFVSFLPSPSPAPTNVTRHVSTIPNLPQCWLRPVAGSGEKM